VNLSSSSLRITKMAAISELLKRNQSYAATAHQPIPTFAELGEKNIEPPHTIVVSCADGRCQPEKFLGLSPQDGVVLIRTVGGHVQPILNDIIALDGFIGIKDLLVIHHTDCGTLSFKDENIRKGLKARLPERDDIDGMSFGAIKDLEQSVRDDLAILRAYPFTRKELADSSLGFVYDLKTGKLTPVKP